MNKIYVFGSNALARNVVYGLKQEQVEIEAFEAKQKKEFFSQLEFESVDAVMLLSNQDDINLDLALKIEEEYPDMQIILRNTNSLVSELLDHQASNILLVNDAQIAAPLFASLAMYGKEKEMPQAVLNPTWGNQDTDSIPCNNHLKQKFRLYWDWRLFITFMAIAFMVAGGTVILHALSDYSWFDSFYHSVVISHGEMDVDAEDNPVNSKIYILLMFASGVILITLLYALVTDYLIRLRLAKALGKLPLPKKGHTVIVGMGVVGRRVAQELYEEGVNLLAVDDNLNSPGISFAKTHNIPVREGSADDYNFLAESLRLSTADTLLVLTDSEILNLECAVSMKKKFPHLKVIIRLFEPRLSRKLEQSSLDISCLSVSYIASKPIIVETLKRLK